MAEELKTEEAASRLTPLEILTRPQTLIDTPTSEAISTHTENPQVPPKTLAQEISPNTKAQFPTELPLEAAKDSQKEEDEIEKDEEEGTARRDEQSTGAGEDEEAEEADEGDEVSGEEGAEEVKSVGEGMEEQTGGGNEGDEEKEVEEENRIVGAEEVAEKVDDEKVDDKKIVEEEVTGPTAEEEAGDRGAETEVEADIVVLDDVTSEDVGTPTDERTTRSHSRRTRNMDDAAPATQQRKLKLNDSEKTGDDIPQAQETPSVTEDVSPGALEERY